VVRDLPKAAVARTIVSGESPSISSWRPLELRKGERVSRAP
jgi:hypothetical protein